MRLRIIAEDITKREFFDFYALEQAYNRYPNNKQIKQYLEFYANIILKDHLNQFANILVDRLAEIENHKGAVKWAQRLGLGLNDDYEITGLDKVSFGQKIEFIQWLVKTEHMWGFTGSTWFQLGKDFLKVCERAKNQLSLRHKILAIDKLLNMAHHGGHVIDYMDERQWLENALNIRDNATPAQIFALASSNVRAVIGRGEFGGGDGTQVSDIQKLHTALRRAAKGNENITIEFNNDKITIHGKIRGLKFKQSWVETEGEYISAKGKVNRVREHFLHFGTIPTQQELGASIEPGDIELGDWQTGTIVVRDDDGDGFHIDSDTGSSRKKKETDGRFYGLAQDLIYGVQRLAASGDYKSTGLGVD
jgi:hypothetical protein